MKQLQPTDFVVWSPNYEYALQFSNGDIILYGDKDEAKADCIADEITIPCTELPPFYQELILKQINDEL